MCACDDDTKQLFFSHLDVTLAESDSFPIFITFITAITNKPKQILRLELNKAELPSG
jgi:hypothetical protein